MSKSHQNSFFVFEDPSTLLNLDLVEDLGVDDGDITLQLDLQVLLLDLHDQVFGLSETLRQFRMRSKIFDLVREGFLKLGLTNFNKRSSIF